MYTTVRIDPNINRCARRGCTRERRPGAQFCDRFCAGLARQFITRDEESVQRGIATRQQRRASTPRQRKNPVITPATAPLPFAGMS